MWQWIQKYDQLFLENVIQWDKVAFHLNIIKGYKLDFKIKMVHSVTS
jgi:hypothetical protein